VPEINACLQSVNVVELILLLNCNYLYQVCWYLVISMEIAKPWSIVAFLL